MFSEDKVTEIFCLADEFCKFFDAQQEKSMLEAPQDGQRRRRKPNRMSDAEIEHSRHRSFNNFIANALSGIAAYCFFEKKPAIDLEFINDGQLSLL